VNLGAEPKKVAWLAGVLVIGAGVIGWADFSSSDSPVPTTPAPVSASAAAAPPPVVRASVKQVERRRVTNHGLVSDWKPRLGPKNPEDRPDPTTIDPTLRLDLLGKIQSVEAGQAGRNLFAFGAAPPAAAAIALPSVPKIVTAKQPAAAPPSFVPGPPPPPQAPPMTFKYYGYKISKTDGHKAAFLLDGDDILIAGENDTVKSRRYRVIKIGVNSITIEDTQFKSTQTLPLQENFPG